MAEGKAASHSEHLGSGSRSRGEREKLRPQQSPIQPCPECGSTKLYRDGMRYTNQGQIQRCLCRSCGYRFSQPKIKVNVSSQVFETLNPGDRGHKNRAVSGADTVQESSNGLSFLLSENIGSHGRSNISTVEKPLNTLPFYNSKRRVCAPKKGAKNLETATETKTVAGDETQQDIKGKIVEFSFHNQKEGLSPATIQTFSYLLRKLQAHSNLLDPESVKETLAKLNVSQNTKATMKGAYSCFLKYLGLSWKPPKIQYQTKIPFIPNEQEIDALIAGCGRSTSAVLQTLKETGMRIGEALRLRWTDINVENNTIILNEPEKGSNPGIYKVSAKLIGMLQALPKKTERVFGKGIAQHRSNTLQQQRNRLAKKLGNPRLKQITFHTLRHWKGTMEYHRTHDPWHVKQLLRHKSLKSTEIYINIEQAIFSESDQQFHVKVASSLEEATGLLAVGFEYIMDIDGKKLLRKRK